MPKNQTVGDSLNMCQTNESKPTSILTEAYKVFCVRDGKLTSVFRSSGLKHKSYEEAFDKDKDGFLIARTTTKETTIKKQTMQELFEDFNVGFHCFTSLNSAKHVKNTDERNVIMRVQVKGVIAVGYWDNNFRVDPPDALRCKKMKIIEEVN